MGGLGNPMFSRNIDGEFDRWQLEPGVHVQQALKPAFLAVRWVESGQAFSKKLKIGKEASALGEQDRYYRALFPLVFEYWLSEQLPATIRVSMLSPQLAGDSATSALPVTLMRVDLTDWKVNVAIGRPVLAKPYGLVDDAADIG
ncbi:GH116 family glycosyl-hydrolase [Saccharospirillum sp.]